MSHRRPEHKEPRSGAILAALSLPDQEEGPEARLDELSQLLASLGVETLGTAVQRKATPDPASLIGRGSEILLKIDRVGKDMQMGQGMCGSLSGSIPTNVGQPMIRVSSMTVGGR